MLNTEHLYFPNFQINYLAFPEDPIWGFDIEPNLGNYIYNEVKSTNFEIHQSDQPLLIDKILGKYFLLIK